jgi:hypothetical protein
MAASGPRPPLDKLDRITETAPLAASIELDPKILSGGVRGRIVLDVTG